MKVPDAVHKRIQEKLWHLANSLNWPVRSDKEKSVLYEEWIRDEQIGGVLSRYVDDRSIRVYIKDTIMKPYGRERIKELAPILKLVGLPDDVTVAETYVKPHGRRLRDGKVICWGYSRDWKTILFAVFERAFLAKSGVPFAAVILHPTGKCQQPDYRVMVDTAARRLGITHIVWHDS